MSISISRKQERSYRIDLIKAVAILCIVLYHAGILTYGYLGVDVFLVISGFFMMKQYSRKSEKDRHYYWNTFIKRVTRVWPILLLAAIVCMLVGFFSMLPDDYESLCESVIASNTFLTNVLSSITVKDYWAISNKYKPLMHTWYVSLLIQAYVFIPLIFIAIDKINKRLREVFIAILALISLLLYAVQFGFSDAALFYYLPFRLFEFLGGACSALAAERINKEIRKRDSNISWSVPVVFLLILALMVLNFDILNKKIRLILIVLLAMLGLFLIELTDEKENRVLYVFSRIGTASFSIYVWHQVILAFFRYIWSPDMREWELLLYFVLTSFVSLLSYKFLEKPISEILGNSGKRKNLFIVCVFVCVLSSGAAFLIYRNAGAVRDVPELDITVDSAKRGMHAEYVDRVYDYTVPFSDEEKEHIFIYGDSMGRDWGNILLESDISDKIEIVYAHPWRPIENQKELLQQADIVFYATLGDAVTFPDDLQDIPYEKLFVVGIKNFGESNGNVYSRRWRDDYHQTSVILGESYVDGMTYYEQDAAQKSQYADHYIELISPVQNSDGSVRVFTSENKFFSGDCEHLTQAGAKEYARILDLAWIAEF